MKIQKLTIHNMASIEDATIDFEAPPLQGSEVFLITGKTGSGKTTILDAICLALFADTPRLDGTLMEGGTKDVDNRIGLDDPRQLMRRNTGEAFVSLTFTGTNGVHYEAVWKVRRSRSKPTGNLQGKSWSLKNMDADYTIEKDVEIRAEIKAAIGLDFNQFCRTTLLAQGEFTRFLNSKDEEKAAILEKITGVDVYTKIGKKVYEVTGRKEQHWKEVQVKAEGTRTMTEEELAAKKEAMAAIDAEMKVVKAATVLQQRRLDWIKTNGELTRAVAKAAEDHREALAMVSGEDYKNKELTVRQWNATIEARNWLTAKNRAEADKAMQQEALSALASDYADVLGGYTLAEQEKQQMEKESKAVGTLLEGEQEKASVYENAQRIAGYLSTIAEGRDKIDASRAAIGKTNKTLAENLQPALDKAQKDVDEARRALDMQEAGLKTQEKAVEELGLRQCRSLADRAKELLQKIATAYVRMEAHAKEQARKEKAAKTLRKTSDGIDKKKKESRQMEPLVRDARVKMDACKEMLDRQRDTIDKFARTMRQKLKEGDVCPVCRQTIECELPHEDELAMLVGSLKEAFTKAETAYMGLVEKKNRIDAEIQAETQSYVTAREAFDSDRSVETAARNAVAACKACGIDTMDGTTRAALASLEAQTKATLEELEARIAEGEEKDRVVRRLRQALDGARRNLEQLKATAQRAQQAISDSKGRIATYEELVRTKKEEVVRAEENAALYIVGRWATDWMACPKEFSTELTKQAGVYQLNVRRKQALDAQLVKVTNDCRMVSDVIEEIERMGDGENEGMRIWLRQGSSHSETAKPGGSKGWREWSGLLKRANDVKSKVSTALVQKKQAEDAIDTNSRRLNAFLDSHEDISLARLADLNGYTPQDISVASSLLDAGRTQVLTKKTLMEEADRKLKEHQLAKLETDEGETAETLAQHIMDYDRRMAELSETKGALNQELRADEENKRQLGKLIAEADRRKADYQRWSRLNQLIGDATGNKFRKIAQSYVLTSLIHSANSYMKTLTDRYTLKVAPGSFVISLEDAYQGYVSRAASTISGGESFLVSLSLALALSDIGQRLAVDTLFIDEGFGTLSGEPLQNAISTLRSLHTKSGRQVGIISHVQELRECIPVQIQVNQEGNNSSSRIKVVNVFD